jgi:hypothetical protein
MVPDPDDASTDSTTPPGDNGERAGTSLSRRTLLGGGGLVAAGLLGGAALLSGGDGTGSERRTQSTRETTPVAESEARRLAERFAPTLYFGRREQWFPTDPRPYTSEQEGETVVDGFDAFDGYTAAKETTDGIDPAPTVFYHVRSYTERLAVVQYWLYGAFDQFSVNFHWHDWELLQAFVDRESDEPVLYVASAHSRTVPNNEYLDPETTPAVISEVGSHSSALGMNERRDTFQRLPGDGLAADVTNGVLSLVSGDEGLPLAYGLPRDEGFRLPYVVPELDGAPLADHPQLPNVSAADLVAGDLTVDSFVDLASPPTDLPARERGPVFGPESRDEGDEGGVDERYTLVPTAEIEDIAAFTGPQLSFDFYVPGFVEDAVASHLTTTPPPWEQPRYDDPLLDVTDSRHRDAIESRFGVDGGDRGAMVVGQVRELQPVGTEAAGVTLAASPVEAVARLASDPVAVPTFNGVAAFVDVDDGDHTLTVNGAGYAPYAQRVRVGGAAETETTTATGTGVEAATETETETRPTGTASGTDSGSDAAEPVRLGSDGRIGLVPNEAAVKLQVDAADRGGARRVRVEDDAAGRVFDAPPVERDGRAGVYVHRAGGYTVEVTDSRGETSIERVNPGPDQNAAEVAKARTGVSGITRFLVDFLTETRETARRQLQRRGGSGGRDGEVEDEDEDGDGDGRSGGDSTDSERATRRPTEAPSTRESTATTETGARIELSTEETASEPTSTATAPRERLLTLLDEAVAAAREADDAAREEASAATVEALQRLRSVLSELAALVSREGAPQPASRIASSRIETADSRAEQALSRLES